MTLAIPTTVDDSREMTISKKLYMAALVAVVVACDHGLDAEFRDGSVEGALHIDNERGRVTPVDEHGSQLSGEVTLDCPWVLNADDDVWATVDGMHIDGPSCTYGDLDYGSADPFRCGCVDSNGSQWSQPCPAGQGCKACCADNGGTQVKIKISPPCAPWPECIP